MPNLNVPFVGGTLIIPGAYYADNVALNNLGAQTPTPPLIFIGFGYGQQPYVPTTYDSPQSLLAAIRGGPCADYVPFLTSPSSQLAGAQQITYINVGANTQSSLTLLSGSSGVVNMTSVNYGLPSNLLQAMVQSGSTAGAKLTLYDGYSQVTAVGDNLGVPLQVAYTGAATGVTYSVTVSGGVATAFKTSSPNAGESVNISLGNGAFSTVASVVEYLNGTGFYSATALSATNGALPSASLDLASGVSLPMAAAPYTFVNVYATLTDLVYWVNNLSQQLATAVIASGITSSSGVAPSALPLTPFAGATSVPPTLANYASGFNIALTQPAWVVFADSNASGVIALGVQHAVTASAPANGQYRRFFTGSAIGDSVATAVQKAKSCNALQACFVYPGIYRTNTATGQNVLHGGHAASAAAAGMATGNPPATPLTNKSMTGNGVEVNLTPAQIDTLQQAGVMPLWVSPQTGVPTIVSDFTTWQNDANPENVFTQQVACRYFLAYSMLNALNPYVGTIASPVTEVMILNAVKNTLNALIYSGTNVNGVVSSWDPTTLQLVYTGAQQLAAITVSVTLVGQNRFITEYVNIQPLNIVISGATGPTIPA